MKGSNGEVEIQRSGTIQVKQFHPVSVAVAIRLPIEDGETPQEAVERVDGICEQEFDKRMVQTIESGWKWDK